MDSTRKIIKNRFRVHKSTKSQKSTKVKVNPVDWQFSRKRANFRASEELISRKRKANFAQAKLTDSSCRSLSHQNGHNLGYVDPNAMSEHALES
ncbi:hypothetical protein QL285_086363 [Trifolium repens]|nr:hypothetical protein QL285_086362 [Trifolium repens]KAK2361180.1 hypothetical protein QL285_086363 [Trifolium repens]